VWHYYQNNIICSTNLFGFGFGAVGKTTQLHQSTKLCCWMKINDLYFSFTKSNLEYTFVILTIQFSYNNGDLLTVATLQFFNSRQSRSCQMHAILHAFMIFMFSLFQNGTQFPIDMAWKQYNGYCF